MHVIRLALVLGSLAAPGLGLAQTETYDPLEPLNRAIFTFNEAVDNAIMLPIARGYRAITPSLVQSGVRNFFSNLEDVRVMTNNLLQAKLQAGASDFMRIAINSTFGLLGLLDVASEMGLRKHNEDFGQTLGRWGFDSGPYLVLPLLGPSSLRDATGRFVDLQYLDPVRYMDDVGPRNRTNALRVISNRTDLIEAKAAVDMAALDGYEYTRDFYLERRRALVYDGRPPRVDEE
ncbi:MAG: VacJ family lipoprotein [Thiobacillaceae bacterium]